MSRILQEMPTLAVAGRHRNAASAEESLSELLEALIALLSRTREDARDMRMQLGRAPAISRGFLRVAGGAVARRFEQGRGRSGVELRIVAVGKGEAAPGAAGGVLVDESP